MRARVVAAVAAQAFVWMPASPPLLVLEGAAPSPSQGTALFSAARQSSGCEDPCERRTRLEAAYVEGQTAAAPATIADGVELTVDGRANANPAVAVDHSVVAVAWGATAPGGPTDVYVALSRDGGRRFGAPVRVSDESSRASLAGEQPPRVALVPRSGRGPAIVVAWTSKGSGTTRLVSSRSDDGGRTFTPPAPFPGTEGVGGNRGWHALVVDKTGGLVASWLDHRDVPSRGLREGADAESHKAHVAHSADGASRAEASKLYVARLDDPESAKAVTGGVCYCCKTAVAARPDGTLVVAWRHVYRGNVRDIAFSVSRDGGRTFAAPARLSVDNWVLDGCPENGPALTADRRDIHVVWPTIVPGPDGGRDPALALFHASSSGGERFGPRQRIETQGTPGHPQVALDGRSRLVVVWDEVEQGHRRVVVARADGAGPAPRLVRHVISGSARASHPMVAAVPHGVLVAWTSGPPASATVRVALIAD